MPRADKAPRPWVALFDLDGTITWRDTFLPFMWGFLLRHPRRLLELWQLPGALCGYWVDRDRGLLKSRIISMAMRGASHAEIDAWAEDFVGALQRRGRLRPVALRVLEAHRTAGDCLVLLSASPDLYVPKIGRLLGFERTLCTEIAWDGDRLAGNLKTPNRRGEEKSHCLKWLRGQYRNFLVIAYGNSTSDLNHMREADRALLVNGNAEARRAAQNFKIATAEWS
jgi:phosphatidylglycerophosphatase C